MNVYIIAITENGTDLTKAHYDAYDCHMVVADSEEEARKMCPTADECARGNVWVDEEYSTCRLVKEGDIVSSFNAG